MVPPDLDPQVKSLNQLALDLITILIEYKSEIKGEFELQI